MPEKERGIESRERNIEKEPSESRGQQPKRQNIEREQDTSLGRLQTLLADQASKKRLSAELLAEIQTAVRAAEAELAKNHTVSAPTRAELDSLLSESQT